MRIFTGMSIREFLVMIICATASALASVLFVLNGIYRAALLATPPYTLYGLSTVIRNITDIYGLMPNDTSIFPSFIYFFVQNMTSSFWLIMLIEIILYMVFLYPYTSRIASGLPTNIYRVKKSPAQLLITTGLVSVLLGLPVTLWPFLSVIFVSIFYIGTWPIVQHIYNYIIIWLILVLMPFTTSILYLGTLRFDLSLLMSLSLSLIYYFICIRFPIHLFVFVPEVLVALILVYVFSKHRWVSTW